LHVRVPVTYREDQGARKPTAVNFSADAFCLSRGRFRPNSKFKPGEDWRQELEFTEVSMLFTPIFGQIKKVNFYFDADPAPVGFEVRGDWKSKQTFTLPQPRKAKVLRIELAEFARDSMGRALLGIDNMWVRIRRPDEAGAKVRPLLNVGGLVKYRAGQGCIVLNNLRVQIWGRGKNNSSVCQCVLGTTVCFQSGSHPSKTIGWASMKRSAARCIRSNWNVSGRRREKKRGRQDERDGQDDLQ